MLFDNVLWPLGLTRSDKKDQILIEISIPEKNSELGGSGFSFQVQNGGSGFSFEFLKYYHNLTTFFV